MAGALLDGDGRPVPGARARTADGELAVGFHSLGHLLVVRPEDRTVWLDAAWRPFPAEGLEVVSDAGEARLTLDGPGLHRVTLA